MGKHKSFQPAGYGYAPSPPVDLSMFGGQLSGLTKDPGADEPLTDHTTMEALRFTGIGVVVLFLLVVFYNLEQARAKKVKEEQKKAHIEQLAQQARMRRQQHLFDEEAAEDNEDEEDEEEGEEEQEEEPPPPPPPPPVAPRGGRRREERRQEAGQRGRRRKEEEEEDEEEEEEMPKKGRRKEVQANCDDEGVRAANGRKARFCKHDQRKGPQYMTVEDDDTDDGETTSRQGKQATKEMPRAVDDESEPERLLREARRAAADASDVGKAAAGHADIAAGGGGAASTEAERLEARLAAAAKHVEQLAATMELQLATMAEAKRDG